ncbi:hypothetical protein KM043_001339 [Ampulex compressa]|nr:hypothetical protein KM043_001339 [Ampulex compressa]
MLDDPRTPTSSEATTLAPGRSDGGNNNAALCRPRGRAGGGAGGGEGARLEARGHREEEARRRWRRAGIPDGGIRRRSERAGSSPKGVESSRMTKVRDTMLSRGGGEPEKDSFLVRQRQPLDVRWSVLGGFSTILHGTESRNVEYRASGLRFHPG